MPRSSVWREAAVQQAAYPERLSLGWADAQPKNTNEPGRGNNKW